MNHEAAKNPPVLLISGEYPPKFCGIGDYTAHLARELAAIGTEVTVITRRDTSRAGRRDTSRAGRRDTSRAGRRDTSRAGRRDTSRAGRRDTSPAGAAGVRGVDVRRMIDNWNVSEARRVLAVVDELGPDTVVHIQYGGFGMRRRPMVNLLPAYLRARRPGCRLVLTLHEYRAHRLRARIPIMPMVMASHGVICVDQPDLPYLRRLGRITHPAFRCIPISPNIMPVPSSPELRAEWRRELGIAGDEPVVLYFGNIEPLKGFPDLVAAVKSLRQGGLGLRLLVVGGFDPDNAWLERHAEGIRESLESGLRDGSVVALPKLPAEQVSHCMHAADVAAFPYIHGARSNRGSLLAAIGHLLPVVTTEGKQTAAGFAEDFGVAVAPAGDVLGVAERLREVLESAPVRQRLRTRMAEVARTFSWREVARRTLDFYHDLEPAVARAEPRELATRRA